MKRYKTISVQKSRWEAGLFCIAEAAVMLGLKKDRLRYLVRTGEVPAPTHLYQETIRPHWTTDELKTIKTILETNLEIKPNEKN